MVLHTVSAVPGSAAFDNCLRIAGNDDRILLLAAGVYAGIAGGSAAEQLRESAATVYALEQDVAAAGLVSALANGIEVVDFAGFVALTEACEQQMNWS